VSNVPGHGARFRVELPLVAPVRESAGVRECESARVIVS
jgi:hypothetical protein